MIVIFLVGSLPVVFADNSNALKRQVKADLPIIFKVSDKEEEVGNSNPSSSSGGSGGGSNGNAVKNRVVTAAQNVVQTTESSRLGQVVRASASEFVQNLTETQSKVFSAMLRAQKNKILEMNHSSALKAVNQYRIKAVNQSLMFKKRDVGEENKAKAALNYGQAVSKYAQLNSAYKGKKAEFQDIKEQLRNCTKDSEECNQLREQGDEAAKEYLLNGANMTLAHLEKLKSNIEGSEYVDEEQAEQMLEKIDATITALEDAIVQAEAAETKDEIKNAAKIIQNIWNRFKNREKVYAAQLYNGGVWNIIRSSENLEQRLDNILKDMEEQGIDVTNISAKIDLFSEYLLDAKNKYDNATDLLEEAKVTAENDGDVSELVDQSKELLREAHQSLKDAHRILIDIIKDIRDAGGDITEESEPEGIYEVVEEAKAE